MCPPSRCKSRRVARQEPGAKTPRPALFWPLWPSPSRYLEKRMFLSFEHRRVIPVIVSPRVHIIRILMSTTCRLPCSSQYSFPFRIRIRTIYAPLIPSASTRSNSSHLKTRRYLHLTLASLEPVLRIVINVLDTIGLMTVLCPSIMPTLHRFNTIAVHDRDVAKSLLSVQSSRP